MATTTNFGWETPDDTDLVKDGAAAIRTLGSAIDTSLVDLKGGTTGQNLRKATNTDMDFTWAGDATNTVIDAEGDLLVGDSADTLQRLAIGTTGQILTVDTTIDGKIKWADASGGSLPTAKARQTVVQSISNNTWTKVTYTTEDWDTGSDFASSTFTCDTAGYYLVTASVNFDSGTAIDYPRLRLYKNGANENEAGINKQEYPHLYINTMVYLAVNDTVEIYIYQDSGTSKNTGGGNRSMWFAVTGIRS